MEQSDLVFTAEGATQTTSKLASIFGESFQDKYFAEESDQKAKQAQTIQHLATAAQDPVQSTFKSACDRLKGE